MIEVGPNLVDLFVLSALIFGEDLAGALGLSSLSRGNRVLSSSDCSVHYFEGE